MVIGVYAGLIETVWVGQAKTLEEAAEIANVPMEVITEAFQRMGEDVLVGWWEPCEGTIYLDPKPEWEEVDSYYGDPIYLCEHGEYVEPFYIRLQVSVRGSRSVGRVMIKESRGDISVEFDAPPHKEIREALRRAGLEFRYGAWFTKETDRFDEIRELVQSLVRKFHPDAEVKVITLEEQEELINLMDKLMGRWS